MVDPADSPAYPAHWEADVVLRDGGTAHLAPISPADADRLRLFHRRQSPESIYLRFFAPYPELTDRDVRRFTHVDHDDRVALIATIGADIVGVVRYDRLGDKGTPRGAEAEVAFNIADAHQGRGLGSVLLEHIAAAARERGVRMFVAEVLPTNRRMIGVFREAGFEVASEFDDGVISLHFDIATTAHALEVMQAREQRAEARSIERLLTPQSVAVIGASRVYESVGQTVLRNLLGAGLPGSVHAVNPGTPEVAGQRTFASVLDVPGSVDLAVVAVPSDAVGQVVEECAAKGVRGLVVLSAGYAESGEEGRARQHDLVAMARAHGMRIVGPNSFGIINTDDRVRLNASLAPAMPPPGRVGFFAQSGALSLAILDAVAQRGLGLSTFVSAGNRADVSGNDLLQFWDEDPSTEVVLLYLESIGNPRKFSRLARRTARTTPIVTVKSGRSTQGNPLGHAVRASTAPAAAVDAMFRQAGVIRVDTISALLDVGQLLATQPLPAGDRVAVVGNSDALGMLAADACAEAHLHVVDRPVNLRPDASAEEFSAALTRAFGDRRVDAVVAVFIPPLVTAHEDVARALATTAAAADKTVVATFLGMRGVPLSLRAVEDGPVTSGRPVGQTAARGSVPSFPSPEDAVRALAAAVRYAEWRRRPPGTVPDLAGIDRAAARTLVAAHLARAQAAAAPGEEPPPTMLRGAPLAEVLACYGITLWPTVVADGLEDLVAAAADLGYPVAMKAMAPRLRSRSDLGDVRLGLGDEAALRAAHAGLATGLGPDAAHDLAVQPMAPPGVPCVITSTEDPLFGPIVSFGLGGVATDLLGDRAFRIPPVTDADARDMVREVAASPLLFGHRGADPVDTLALEDLLLRVARLADDLPEVAELALDPVLVAVEGLSILHGRMRLTRPVRREDQGPRRLSE